MTEIGQKTFFDSGTLTPIIKKLEEKQFLKRVAVKEDERMKKVILLEKALASKVVGQNRRRRGRTKRIPQHDGLSKLKNTFTQAPVVSMQQELVISKGKNRHNC
jgi:hypothetical protein